MQQIARLPTARDLWRAATLIGSLPRTSASGPSGGSSRALLPDAGADRRHALGHCGVGAHPGHHHSSAATNTPATTAAISHMPGDISSRAAAASRDHSRRRVAICSTTRCCSGSGQIWYSSGCDEHPGERQHEPRPIEAAGAARIPGAVSRFCPHGAGILDRFGITSSRWRAAVRSADHPSYDRQDEDDRSEPEQVAGKRPPACGDEWVDPSDHDRPSVK